MIIAAIPYCPRDEGEIPEPGRDFGHSINQTFERLREDDWLLILDHDLYITTRDWYRRLENAVEKYPDAGFFTLLRFPAVNTWSVPKGIKDKKSTDIAYHRGEGHRVAKEHDGEIVDVTDYKKLKPAEPTSGIFLMRKSVWREVGGFKPGHKLEHIDHDMHIRIAEIGYRIYLLMDVYLFHAKYMK